MATIAKLVEDKFLFEIEVDVELTPGFSPTRRIYGMPSLVPFLNGLSSMVSPLGLEDTPEQQMDFLLYEFLGAGALRVHKKFGPIYPPAGAPWPGVWKLKTPDLRIFGWFPEKDVFIAVEGDDATKIKKHKLYHGFLGSVVRHRGNLNLDPPKFVAGEEFSDVISLLNFT